MTTPAGFPGSFSARLVSHARVSFPLWWSPLAPPLTIGFTWCSGHLEGIGVRSFIQPLILKAECTSSSCAWRAPRVLSGFLASTPQSSQEECALRSKLGTRTPAHRTSVSLKTLI